MVIGVPKEIYPAERRVALVPGVIPIAAMLLPFGAWGLVRAGRDAFAFTATVTSASPAPSSACSASWTVTEPRISTRSPGVATHFLHARVEMEGWTFREE